jgi:hypothetical protein
MPSGKKSDAGVEGAGMAVKTCRDGWFNPFAALIDSDDERHVTARELAL